MLDHAAIFTGHWTVVATEAGLVYLLGPEGVGHRRWQLPSPPTSPPTADTDSIYVSCRDGATYALTDDDGHADDVYWTADTGWTERGIGAADGLVFVASHGTLYVVAEVESDEYALLALE